MHHKINITRHAAGFIMILAENHDQTYLHLLQVGLINNFGFFFLHLKERILKAWRNTTNSKYIYNKSRGEEILKHDCLCPEISVFNK